MSNLRASTPDLEEGSLPVCDNESRGQLASSAARIMMKCLWLAQLPCSDIMVAATTLASRVASWSPNDDRRFARSIQCVAATPDHSPIVRICTKPSELWLCVWTRTLVVASTPLL